MMKVGNFIYYNIKELVAIRLISIRNWNYLHTLHDNFIFGFCKNRTLNHKFPTERGRWQNINLFVYSASLGLHPSQWGCQIIIQKAWQLSIVGHMFEECHALGTLNTSFVHFEKRYIVATTLFFLSIPNSPYFFCVNQKSLTHFNHSFHCFYSI